MIQLYNTLTRQTTKFDPIDPSNVRMYVCGPTVYDFAHIGNARPVIVFDVLFRLLRHYYGAGHVTYARNITDVDDKINARALHDFPNLSINDAIRHLTDKTIAQFQHDTKALGCLDPTVQPRATDNIEEIIDMIIELIGKGYAYFSPGSEGILFDISAMTDYGKLSQRDLEDQQAGIRIEVDTHKRHPRDFVLWKTSTDEEPGWMSPWGWGRPGWHIECSAMSNRYLGQTFDIHGGGIDLIFPHHENEIAQSRCAHGTDVMANVWMHNGFLQVDGQKMAKSAGNFTTIADVLKDWDGIVARYAMLTTHYTQPIDWTRNKLLEAKASMQKFERWYVPDTGVYPNSDVVAALNDDLNTPAAFRILHTLADQLNDDHTLANIASFSSTLDLLGIAPQKIAMPPVLKQTIEDLIAVRNTAKANKDWKESDRIRNTLFEMGVQVNDNKDGTITWEMRK
jgi:cysteinyl-tRNA synthetase